MANQNKGGRAFRSRKRDTKAHPQRGVLARLLSGIEANQPALFKPHLALVKDREKGGTDQALQKIGCLGLSKTHYCTLTFRAGR